MANNLRINENTNIGLPLRNLIGLIGAIIVGAWFAFGVIERLNQLETKNQLMEADLLKKAEQTPKNLEIYMLIEHNAKQITKHQKQLDDNVHTKVLLMEAEKKINKLQEDVEKLIRKNGN